MQPKGIAAIPATAEQHKLTLDYKSGFLIAICSCGNWQHQIVIDGEIQATAAYPILELLHRQHRLDVRRTTPAP